jgi:hypothetical protein
MQGPASPGGEHGDVYLSRRTSTLGRILGFTIALGVAVLAVLSVLAADNNWVCGHSRSPVCVHDSGD